MFTNEFEFDENITTILDDRAQYEDIQIFLDEAEVYIRQWNESEQDHDFVVMSAKMFRELLESMNQSEGAFTVR